MVQIKRFLSNLDRIQLLSGGIVLVIAVVFGILVGFDSETRIGDSPPEIMLVAGNEAISGVEGTYCWGGKCVLKTGAVSLTENKSVKTISKNTTLHFKSQKSEPNRYTYRIYDMNQTLVHNGSTTSEFNLSSISSGDYALSSSGWWDNGDVRYAYKIRLVE